MNIFYICILVINTIILFMAVVPGFIVGVKSKPKLDKGNMVTSNIGDLTSEKALSFILNSNIMGTAAKRTTRYGKHWEVTIGIGNDHTASVTLDDEAYQELLSRMEGISW